MGVRVVVDDRDNYNPGWKFNYWELKGTPIRFELGKKDLEKGELKMVKRFNGEKSQLKWDQIDEVPKILDQIHESMYENARQIRDAHLKDAYTWEEFMNALNGKNIVLTPWCQVNECEVGVKDKSKEESLKTMADAGGDEEVLTGSAKTLCLPFDPKTPLKEGDKCFHCGKDAKIMALWGRSY